VIYFAYGSNMSTKRLLHRVPSAHVLEIGTLHSHQLVFHKVSDVDGSGKADIIAHHSMHVMGVLYRLDREDKATLDRLEGLGTGYAEKRVTIIDGNDSPITAVAYVATVTDPDLKPYTWYLQHVVEGKTRTRHVFAESWLFTANGVRPQFCL